MKKKADINRFIAEYAIILIFIVLFEAMSIFAPNFMTGDNITNVLRQISINGICAVGMTFVMLTGGIDLSVGSIIAVSGVLTAMMMLNGSWQKPGVYTTEEFDPDPYMDALNKWGLPWQINENPVLVD